MSKVNTYDFKYVKSLLVNALTILTNHRSEFKGEDAQNLQTLMTEGIKDHRIQRSADIELRIKEEIETYGEFQKSEYPDDDVRVRGAKAMAAMIIMEYFQKLYKF
jgi:hypothetical protein